MNSVKITFKDRTVYDCTGNDVRLNLSDGYVAVQIYGTTKKRPDANQIREVQAWPWRDVFTAVWSAGND